MDAHQKTRTRTRTRAQALLIAVIGLADSLYLVSHHVSVTLGFQRQPSLCNIGGTLNCDEVAKSPYAVLLGVPVASWGLFYYLVFLSYLLLFSAKPGDEAKDDVRAFEDGIFAFSSAGLAACAWFAFVSMYFLHYVCLFCSLLYVAGAALFIAAWRAQYRTRPAHRALFAGIHHLVWCFIFAGPWLKDGERKVLRVLIVWLWILVMALGTYLLPPLLVDYYFEPRDRQHYNSESIKLILEQWSRELAREVPVNVGGSPEERDSYFGAADAPLTIVDFSDYQCPVCRTMSRELKRLVKERPDEVRVVIKHFPLDKSCNSAMKKDYHEFACRASLMARCAEEQGVEDFRRMHEALIELDPFLDWNLQTLLELPIKLGLNIPRFDRCMIAPQTMSRIQADIQLAGELRITGTPTLVVDGKKLPHTVIRVLPGVIGEILKQQRKLP